MTIQELMTALTALGKPDMHVVLSGEGDAVHEVNHVEVIGCILGAQGRHAEVALNDNPPGMTNAVLLHSASDVGARHVPVPADDSADSPAVPDAESADPQA